MPEIMTVQEQVSQQNEAIRTLSAAIQALIEELHEAEVIDRHNVANRLRRLRAEGGGPLPLVEEFAAVIDDAAFASTTTRDTFSVVTGGKESDE